MSTSKKIRIIETDISDLTPDPQNPRKRTPLSAGVIQRSLEQFGACRSIVVDENGVVRAGNGTLEEAGQLGIEKVIVVETSGNELVAVKRSGLTEEQWKQYAIADNTASDFSTWDASVLSEIAEQVDLDGFFPADKMDEVLAELAKQSSGFTEQEEDEDDLQDVLDNVGKVESRVKLGDIWALGRHRLCCCDSTVEKNVRALLGDRFNDVGMVWSDSPYGMRLNADFSSAKSNRDFAQDKKAFGGNKYDNIIGDHEDFDPRVLIGLFKGKEQFWWGADYYAERLPDKNEGSWFVWDKRVEESMDAVYGSAFELCWSIKKHKRQIVRIKWAGIFGMEKEDTKKRVHPTQKPIALCEWVFEKYGQPDDLIFDPFLGSAPSIIAAQKMEGDRTVFGCELSLDYCETILQRFSNFTGIVPELVGRLPE